MINEPAHHQFITDETGKRISVILSMEKYEELLEDLEDLAAIAERRDEPTVSHDDLLAGLRRDGTINLAD